MSIINQVNMCIREIDMIGKSKRAAKKNGVKGIHSYKTKNEVLKIAKQFANWARSERGVKNLHDLTEADYQAFLESKAHTTLDYRRSIETHLRLLQEGLNRRAERYGKEAIRFVPEKRLIAPRRRLEAVSNRSYSEREVKAIKERVSPSTARAVALMRNLGLRVSESVQLRVEHVQGDFIRIEGDTITKGGRDREIPIPASFQQELEQMCLGKTEGERLVPLMAGTVMDDVKEACRELNIKSRGTHGFRHSYARERVQQEMTTEQKAMFERCLDRYAEGKKADYGVYDKELYDATKAIMDKIHGELGHGKNRFDLAVRYMR